MTTDAHAIGASPSAPRPALSLLRGVPWLLLALAYFVAAGLLICLSRDQINPDAISYMQSARQYAAGRTDLAVNSWFGPLLAWLLIPAASTELTLPFAAKLISAFAGLGFAAGAAALTRRFLARSDAVRRSPAASPGSQETPHGVTTIPDIITSARSSCLPLVAFAAALLLALGMLPSPITPDVLLACLITWYLVAAGRLLDASAPDRRGRAFLAGLVGGVAYLAKAYALPFVLVHLAITLWFASRASAATQRRRGTEEEVTNNKSNESGKLGANRQYASPVRNRLASWRSLLLPYFASVLGLLLPAGPWIAVISLHDGHFTTSSAQRGVRAFSPVEASPLPMEPVQAPRAGRINVWENPVECSIAWPHWSPLDGARGLKLQLETFRVNGSVAWQVLWNADALKLLLLSLVAGCGWCAASRMRRRRAEQALPLTGMFPPVSGLWSPLPGLLPWACLSALLYIGGYVAVYAEERFLWPAYGLLVAICTCLLAHSLTRFRRPILRIALVAVVALSMAYRPGVVLQQWSDESPSGMPAQFGFITAVSRWLPAHGPLASNKWHEGLFACWQADRPFLGQVLSAIEKGDAPVDPAAVAAELAPYGRSNLVIFYHEKTVKALLADPRFTLLMRFRHSPTGNTAAFFLFDPHVNQESLLQNPPKRGGTSAADSFGEGFLGLLEL